MRAVRQAPLDPERSELAREVRFYLEQTPRQLPSRLLYDALGSALFDAICHLPWYRITRAELALLRGHAGEIGRVLGPRGRVVELGCGNGDKLATLLTHAGLPRAHAHLIDVSASALARSVQTLTSLPTPVRVTTHATTYEEGLAVLPSADSPPTLLAFLGSNIGNFDPPGAQTLLRRMRAALRRGDHLLLGVDLVKPRGDLLLAYDDPLGLTAAFDKNLLLRLNDELGADFDLDRFDHRAVWNAEASRVEMHLVSRIAQEVAVADADLRFTLQPGETIWTESSYKFEPEGVRRLVEPAGFAERASWIDGRARFSLSLFAAV
ncbi:MAG TPA: L-histidine N(alpha)-methyltransferase [Candidatus Bathyarchaeia archaeon]|nr:L-histidine N(alpha)-methyltransferase [Candidatus Bathyarchaeia archaeon]